MQKGIDYIGITVSFRCHDGQGNYVMVRRGQNCRDERGCWDFGGGGLKFGETIEECLLREIQEEYGTKPESYEFIGHKELHRTHEGLPTHWLQFQYRVLLDRKKVVNNEPDNHDELGWFTLDNLPSPQHSTNTPDQINVLMNFEESAK